MTKKKVKPRVNITLIIDRSGSMSSIENEVVGGINSFMEEQKKLPDPATVTFVQFDNIYEVVYKDVALADVKPMTQADFVPRGMTALYDAIGMTLAGIDKETKSPQIVVIMTDGAENSSKEYDHKKVKDIVESSQKLGWQIIFMGANIDAEKVGGSFGIPQGNTVTYAATNIGASASMSSMSTKFSSMRTAYSSGTQDWHDAGGDMATLYSKSVENLKK